MTSTVPYLVGSAHSFVPSSLGMSPDAVLAVTQSYRAVGLWRQALLAELESSRQSVTAAAKNAHRLP